MTVKITTANGGSDSLDFGCAQTAIVATVTGTEVSSGEGKLEFKTTTGGTSATKATVLANGNVGIGTTAPAVKLQIGSAGGVSHNGYTKLSVENGDHCVLAMRSPNDKICQIIFDDVDAVSRGQISYNHNEDSLAFATAATNWLTITSAGLGRSGFTAKAWVNFNGTGTVAIVDSHNVSSITDVATGKYIANLGTALTGNDTGAVSCNAMDGTDNGNGRLAVAGLRNSSTISIHIGEGGASPDYTDDTDHNPIHMILFGD